MDDDADGVRTLTVGQKRGHVRDGRVYEQVATALVRGRRERDDGRPRWFV